MEKYGQIPPRFSKAWWEYYWYYYKWQTIGIAFVLLLLVITLVQCANKVHYDLQITYAGERVYTEQSIEALTSAMEQEIDDVTGNGKNDILFQQLTIAKEGTDNAATEYNYAMATKLDLEFQSTDTYLFLFSGEQVNRMLDRQYAEELFEAVDVWAAKPVDAAITSKKKGTAYAVSLADNAYLNSLGFTGDDLYLAVRKMPASDKKKAQQNYHNAVRLANVILGNRE